MLKPTLSRRVEDALTALEGADDLLKLLESLDSIFAQVDTHLLAIAKGGGNTIPENASAAHSQMASLPSITKAINARKLFRGIESLEFQLSTALAEGLDDPKHILEPISQLDEFAEKYNDYVVHQTGSNALPLLIAARRLKQTLSDLRTFLTYLRVNSSGLLSAEEGETEFSLVLSNVLDLQDFASKLQALNELYAEICYVLQISAASHPLRIGKIESGSLWTRLFGDTRAVGLMIGLIEASVRYFHRNYTTEGKIAAIPKKIESLDAILQFSNRLKESGADVTALNDSLAKNAATITESLNRLVSDQPIVEVNGQVFNVNSEIERLLLQQTSMRKISYETATSPEKLHPPPTE